MDCWIALKDGAFFVHYPYEAVGYILQPGIFTERDATALVPAPLTL